MTADDLNLLDRICHGLTLNTGKWIHSHVIYVKMQQKGYDTEAIKRALNIIHHEPPYAVMKVDSTDDRTLKDIGVSVGGWYYTRHPDGEWVEKAKEAMREFETI